MCIEYRSICPKYWFIWSCANDAETNGRKWVVDHLMTFHYRPLLLLPGNKIMPSCPPACAEGKRLILRYCLKGILLHLDIKPLRTSFLVLCCSVCFVIHCTVERQYILWSWRKGYAYWNAVLWWQHIRIVMLVFF